MYRFIVAQLDPHHVERAGPRWICRGRPGHGLRKYLVDVNCFRNCPISSVGERDLGARSRLPPAARSGSGFGGPCRSRWCWRDVDLRCFPFQGVCWSNWRGRPETALRASPTAVSAAGCVTLVGQRGRAAWRPIRWPGGTRSQLPFRLLHQGVPWRGVRLVHHSRACSLAFTSLPVAAPIPYPTSPLPPHSPSSPLSPSRPSRSPRLPGPPPPAPWHLLRVARPCRVSASAGRCGRRRLCGRRRWPPPSPRPAARPSLAPRCRQRRPHRRPSRRCCR